MNAPSDALFAHALPVAPRHRLRLLVGSLATALTLLGCTTPGPTTSTGVPQGPPYGDPYPGSAGGVPPPPPAPQPGQPLASPLAPAPAAVAPAPARSAPVSAPAARPIATPSPAQAAPAPYRPSAPVRAPTPRPPPPDTGEKVHLNFVDADLPAVVRALAQFTGRNFLVDPRVKGTITLVSEGPVSSATSYNMLLGALRMQGFAVVDVDGVSRVIPEADAKLQGMAVQTASASTGSELVTRVFQLNYENAANLVPVLRPMIAPNNPINAYPGNNTLVITDYADNLDRIGRVIANIDTPTAIDTDVVALQHGIATDVAMLAAQMLDSPQSDPNQRIMVVADPRSNSVLIRASSPARTRLAADLVRRLDSPNARPGNLHVVYLRNAQATKLAEVLRGALTGQSGGDGNSGNTHNSLSGNNTSGGLGMGSGTGMGGQSSGSSPGLGGSSMGSGSQGNSMMSGSMGGMGQNTGSGNNNSQQATAFSAGGATVQADPTTNTLIISAPEPLYRSLREVIDQLDQRRAQVLVESMIVEVNTTTAAEFGIQWMAGSNGLGTNGRSVFGGANFGGSGLNANGATTIDALGGGLTLGVVKGTIRLPGVGEILNLNLLARALQTDGDANVLSTPNLMTLDNEAASIMVGKTVPFVTGQYVTSGSGNSNNPFQTVSRTDVGLTLRIRPQISEGGTVKLDIYQEVSSIDEQLSATAGGLATNKRAIETSVLVDDGQIIVLGGLLEDRVSDGSSGVPGLSSIPILGQLFRRDSRNREKTNLMVFLRPYVVRDSMAGAGVTLDRYDHMRRLQSQAQPAERFVLPDMKAPILPPAQVPGVSSSAYDLRPQAVQDTLRRDPPVTATSQQILERPAQPAPPPDHARLVGASLASDPAAVHRLDNLDATVLQVANVETQQAAESIAAQAIEAGIDSWIQVAPGGLGWLVRARAGRDARAVDGTLATLRGLGHSPQLVTRP